MVVLATKIYVEGDARDRTLDSLESLIDNALSDLDVSWDIGLRHDNFPTITIDGPDATVARNLLREQWGEVVTDREPGDQYIGTLDAWSADGFQLDAGEEIHIPEAELGLGPGTPEQIRTRFGLVQHTRLRFIEDDPPRLASAERDRLFDWRRGNGRVNINSATRSEVRATVNRAGHAEDIITVERLGLLEQSVICGEGTDPPGLIATIGEYLPSEMLAVLP